MGVLCLVLVLLCWVAAIFVGVLFGLCFVIDCFSHFCGVFVWPFTCFVMKHLASVLSSFVIILLMKRELFALLELCSCSRVDACVLCFFLVLPWVRLLSVIVTFLNDTVKPV